MTRGTGPGTTLPLPTSAQTTAKQQFSGLRRLWPSLVAQVNRPAKVGLVALAVTLALIAAGCEMDQYDTWNSCVYSDGKYQVEISIRHDSDQGTDSTLPRAYKQLCRALTGSHQSITDNRASTRAQTTAKRSSPK